MATMARHQPQRLLKNFSRFSFLFLKKDLNLHQTRHS
jgi:hypothetical protein